MMSNAWRTAGSRMLCALALMLLGGWVMLHSILAQSTPREGRLRDGDVQNQLIYDIDSIKNLEQRVDTLERLMPATRLAVIEERLSQYATWTAAIGSAVLTLAVFLLVNILTGVGRTKRGSGSGNTETGLRL